MRQFDLIQRLDPVPVVRQTATDNPALNALIKLGANGMGAVSPMNKDTDPVRRADLEFDYMGASEFEFGAVPKAAARIVSDMGKLLVVTQTLVRPTYEEPVHFVCTDEQAETVLPAWHQWSRSPRSRERPQYFKDADEDYSYGTTRTIAWWALNEGLIWTRDVTLAEKLKEGFTQRKRELFAQRSLAQRLKARLTGSAPQ